MPERRARFHIDTLRLRVPARDAPAGRRAALDLVQDLAVHGPELVRSQRADLELGGLKVRVPLGRAGDRRAVSNAVTSALSRSVARAGRRS